MKFKKFSRLAEDAFEEEFTNQRTKEDHYQRHVVKGREYAKTVTADDYEAIADTLARTSVDYRHIFGYETTAPDGDTRTRYAKYNKETEDFVVYGWREKEPQIISLHKKTWRQYTIDKAVKYLGEIPEGK